MKLVCAVLLAASAHAQLLDLSSLDKFADRAKESTVITLDESKLKLASGLLKTENEKGKAVLDGLKAVNIRTFEFAKKGVISWADFEPVRKQLTQPGWSRIVQVKEEQEMVEVYMFTGTAGNGLAVLTMEPTEANVINISGKVDLNSLGNLKGALPIPEIQSAFGKGQLSPPKGKKDD